MDASTHADKKGERKERRDDVKQGGAEGRYEGGNDSDQNRQAGRGHERHGEKAPTRPVTPADKTIRGMEEE